MSGVKITFAGMEKSETSPKYSQIRGSVLSDTRQVQNTVSSAEISGSLERFMPVFRRTVR